MAIVVESVTQTLVGANDTTPTFNMPATRPDGDLYLGVIGCDGTLQTQVLPIAGTWSFIGAGNEGTVGCGYWKRIGGSEPASYTGAGNSEEYVGYIYRLSGYDTTTPTADFASTTGNSTAASAPATTATAAGGVVFRGWGIDTDNPTYSSGPTGHTFRGGASSSAGGAGSAYVGTATRDAATTASESVAAATMPGTYDDNWGGVTLVVNVAVAVTPEQKNWIRTGHVQNMYGVRPRPPIGRSW